ncbi:MAG TPA: glycosyltransferase [Rubricoccaceae bacterium]|jgi:glycosyltransferase involved in cell wall biosynthesis
MRSLFVTWDGPGSNYHESLFLPILDRARRPGDVVHLMQYAWESDARSATVAAAAARLGMPYTARGVWRRPALPATAAMVARGTADIARYAWRHRIDVLFPRSIVPAAMALGALRVLPAARLLYDADGLVADERADFGGWSRGGRAYRAFTAVERAAVRRADVLLVRSEAARDVLASRAGDASVPDRTVVVTNGKDEALFSPGIAASRAATRARLGIAPEAPVVLFAGSMGTPYNPDRMVAFFEAVRQRRPESVLVLLTGSPDEAAALAAAHRLPETSVRVRHAAPDEVPVLLAAADVGLGFYAPALSMQARAPIKVGEYLLCGLPALCTRGVGDVDRQLEGDVGRLLPDLSDETLAAAAAWAVEDLLPARDVYRTRCRDRGLALFTLGRSARLYREAFDRLDAR